MTTEPCNDTRADYQANADKSEAELNRSALEAHVIELASAREELAAAKLTVQLLNAQAVVIKHQRDMALNDVVNLNAHLLVLQENAKAALGADDAKN